MTQLILYNPRPHRESGLGIIKLMGLRQQRVLNIEEAPWWGEYLAQYREAAKFVMGKRVLDIGCGQGFGSRYLFDHGAIEVMGLDQNQNEIRFAQDHFGRDGVSYIAQRAESLHLPLKSIDVITCFQVLELSKNPDEILHQASKVLDNQGVAIFTTVNRKRFSALHEAPVDVHHLQEFDYNEFLELSKMYFQNVEIKGLHCLRPWTGILLQQSRNLNALNMIADKIPLSFRNSITQTVFGHSYFPSPKEFELKTKDVERAPLFYAICKKS